jgi:S-(hydroxymethyl)mycothiol dehydrogenase
MTEILAALCREIGAALSVETVRLAGPGPAAVRVRMEAVAICASDIAYADGAWDLPLPALLGHEGVGRVVETGAGVTEVSPGDRVLVTLLRGCRACPACAGGRGAYCRAAPDIGSPITLPDGTPVTQAMHCGAFAEEVVVHASQLARVPETLAPEAACLLSCGVITGVGAVVNAARLRPGETAVIVGAGGVGLSAIQGAAIAGAARIVAMDVSEDKLASARALGATDTILATEPRPWRHLAAIAPGLADAVILCTGAIAAFRTAPRLLAPGGRMVLAGLPHSGQTAAYEPAILASLGQSIVGTKMGDTVLARDIPRLLDLAAQGRLQLEALVSGRWPLDRINEAIADTRAGHARRNVILF